MSTSWNQMQQFTLAQISFEEIDTSIRSYTMEESEGNTLLPSKPSAGVTRVLQIYTAVKPLLKALAVLPLLPAVWRSALQLFVIALDEAATFKAGKDLSEEAGS